ncbi:MAG: YqgE/AlgH family protein [Alphaproteobacteria bacterium]|nr:YqgE/AlgH family protein [Alphaproteobacteria bacterium]
MKITRKNIIDAVGLLALAVLFVWFPYKLKRPDVADHRILVATERMEGGIFDKTVILILRHNGYGAMGLVLNKPPLQKGDADWGGPVGENRYYTLHSLDVSTKKTVKIPDLQLGYTKGEAFAKEIGGMKTKPEEYIIFKGYSGWGRGQLDRELAGHRWTVIDFNRDLVFHTSPKKMWDAATRMPLAEPKKNPP